MATTTIIESFELNLKACVREVAGKRMVFSGTWQDKNVFVKVFTHPESAERHWKRDLEGIKTFSSKGILSPELLWSGKFPIIENISSENSYALIVEAIPNAKPLTELWIESNNKVELTEKIITVLASHHKAGLLQTDLHFGNFIFSNEQCYSLDGDALHVEDPLPIQKAAKNYALLTAQTEVIYEDLFLGSIKYYCQLTKYNATEFKNSVVKNLLSIRKKRCHKLLKKIYRDCTAINTYNLPGRRSFINSKHDSPELRKLIENPESFFPEKAEDLLKNGNSATVALVECAGKKMVVKRYNYRKNIKTFIRRFRKSRASISWANSFRLQNYGMHTPEPCALIETFKGPMVDHAYFISEHIDGECLSSHIESNPKNLDVISSQMKDIFSVWKKCFIAHGDCKATNFIVAENRIYIIDLDAMMEFNKEENFLRAHEKDVKRWLKNWENKSDLEEKFKTVFQP